MVGFWFTYLRLPLPKLSSKVGEKMAKLKEAIQTRHKSLPKELAKELQQLQKIYILGGKDLRDLVPKRLVKIHNEILNSCGRDDTLPVLPCGKSTESVREKINRYREWCLEADRILNPKEGARIGSEIQPTNTEIFKNIVKQSRQSERSKKYPREVREKIIELRENKKVWRKIADELNKLYPKQKQNYKAGALRAWACKEELFSK